MGRGLASHFLIVRLQRGATFVEVPNPDHPLGARGVGEIAIAPPMAAVANAIFHAVGVRIMELPRDVTQRFRTYIRASLYQCPASRPIFGCCANGGAARSLQPTQLFLLNLIQTETLFERSQSAGEFRQARFKGYHPAKYSQIDCGCAAH